MEIFPFQRQFHIRGNYYLDAISVLKIGIMMNGIAASSPDIYFFHPERQRELSSSPSGDAIHDSIRIIYGPLIRPGNLEEWVRGIIEHSIEEGKDLDLISLDRAYEPINKALWLDIMCSYLEKKKGWIRVVMPDYPSP
jgi:hypothetical protein